MGLGLRLGGSWEPLDSEAPRPRGAVATSTSTRPVGDPVAGAEVGMAIDWLLEWVA